MAIVVIKLEIRVMEEARAIIVEEYVLANPITVAQTGDIPPQNVELMLGAKLFRLEEPSTLIKEQPATSMVVTSCPIFHPTYVSSKQFEQ
jgi:hypothetical protein